MSLTIVPKPEPVADIIAAAAADADTIKAAESDVIADADSTSKRTKKTALVNTYDAKGEAIAVEVEHTAAPETPENAAPDVEQLNLPGFEGRRYPDVMLNISGRVELDLRGLGDRLLWESVDGKHEETVTLVVRAIVADRKYHPKIDRENAITGRNIAQALRITEIVSIEQD